MLDASMSGCINHPGIEAVARCKQCGKPVCSSCVITGSTGRFCSESCQERHEKFIGRAQELQRFSRSTGFLQRLKRALIRLAIAIGAIVLLGFVAVFFEVPVVAGIVRSVLDVLSQYLPFL